MPPIWKPQSPEILQSWIDAILDNSENLSNWEQEFVTSVESQLKLRGQLSRRQEEILERIYAEKT